MTQTAGGGAVMVGQCSGAERDVRNRTLVRQRRYRKAPATRSRPGLSRLCRLRWRHCDATPERTDGGTLVGNKQEPDHADHRQHADARSQVGTHGQTGSDQGYQGQGSGQGQGQTHDLGQGRSWNDPRPQREMQQGDRTRPGPAEWHEPARQGPAAGQPEPTGPAEPLISTLARRSPSFGRGFFLCLTGRRRRLPGGNAASSAASRSASVGVGSFQRWTRTVWRPGIGSSLRTPRSAGRPRPHRGRAIWLPRRPTPWRA